MSNIQVISSAKAIFRTELSRPSSTLALAVSTRGARPVRIGQGRTGRHAARATPTSEAVEVIGARLSS
jgi:hypothetical protein